MSGGTVPSVAEIDRQLDTAAILIARATAILVELEGTARVDGAAALIEQLTRLRDLAGAFAAIALHLEVFARDETERARALLATTQLALTADDASGAPDGR